MEVLIGSVARWCLREGLGDFLLLEGVCGVSGVSAREAVRSRCDGVAAGRIGARRGRLGVEVDSMLANAGDGRMWLTEFASSSFRVFFNRPVSGDILSAGAPRGHTSIFALQWPVKWRVCSG